MSYCTLKLTSLVMLRKAILTLVATSGIFELQDYRMALLHYLLRVLLLLFLLPAVSCVANSSDLCTHEEIASCSCFSYLVEQVRENDENLFEIQNVFLPPNAAPPVFVVVTYRFQDAEGEEIGNEVWFWSTSVFYIWQPLHVFQFTSLFFSNTRL